MGQKFKLNLADFLGENDLNSGKEKEVFTNPLVIAMNRIDPTSSPELDSSALGSQGAELDAVEAATPEEPWRKANWWRFWETHSLRSRKAPSERGVAA